jgi:Beta propeller domain
VGKRTAVIALVAALGGTVAVEALDGQAAASARGNSLRLVRFAGCGALLDYMKHNALPSVTATGFLGQIGVEAVGPVPPPPPPRRPGDPVPVPSPPVPGQAIPRTNRESPAASEDDFSTTNVQEAGVDEPDIAKSNGSTLFALAGGQLHSVNISGESPRRLDSLAVSTGADRHELLLHRGTLLVLSHDDQQIDPRSASQSSPPVPWNTAPPKTTLTRVDVSRPGRMSVVQRLTFDGRYLNARLVRGSVRVALTSAVPNELSFFRPRHFAFPDEALERNRAVIASSRAANWLPSFELRNPRTNATSERSVQCRHVARPPAFSGFGLLTVLTIDLDRGLEPVEMDAIVGDGDLVYASERSLYVATERWAVEPVRGFPSPPPTPTTLHKFDISPPDRTAYRASGVVAGELLNQWSLSEHDGVLRVASTRRAGAESLVTTFRERAGELVQIGRVAGLGLGERIFGVRFIGDVGYVVTFRQTDPLYTLDLSQPEKPRLLGELKIPGYSAYLHPAGANLLLGLGQDATEEGITTGTQLSVFDVSDLRKPVRLHRRAIPGAWSEAEADHHAFLYWGRTRLVVVPVATHSTIRSFRGVIGFRLARDGLEEVGRIQHGSAKPIRRTFVARGKLLTVSDAGVRANELGTFAPAGWAAFGATP